MQRVYVDIRACVRTLRLGMDVSEWVPVNVGLMQGSVMSPWLFNVYMDGVVLEVNARMLDKGSSNCKRSNCTKCIVWSRGMGYQRC